jgi:hypothetical protein
VKALLVVAIAAGALALAAPAGATVFFKSPSGNIGCGLSAQWGARCDIRVHAWKAPKKPKWCDVDWGSGLEVGRRGTGRVVCAGDTVFGGKRVLGYRRSVRRGRFKCTSYRNGVRCVNGRTSHGFKISRRKAAWF